MKLRLTRTELEPKYTGGKLEVWKEGQWNYLCDTMEFGVPSISDTPTKTAIPYGRYTVTMNIQSPLHTNYRISKWARCYRAYIPRLVNVKGFDGVLIRPGDITQCGGGCIVVGVNREKTTVRHSLRVWNSLMEYYFIPIKRQRVNKETITLEII